MVEITERSSIRGADLARSLIAGGVIGALTSFSNSYGYAVSGYTTSELSPIVAGVLTYLVLRLVMKIYSVFAHIAAVAFAVGIDITTTLTSGMLITYTMFAERSNPEAVGMAPWVYRGYTAEAVLFYLFASAVSAGGVLVALSLSDHFIERERLVFPVGGGAWRVVNVIRNLEVRKIAITILVGYVLELAALYRDISADLAQVLYLIAPGASIAFSFDPLVLLLALLLPVGSSIGVGLGSIATFLLAIPILAYLGIVIPLPTMSTYDIASSASSSIASLLIGYLILTASYYITKYRKLFLHSLTLIREIREYKTTFYIGVLLISLPVIPALLISKDTLRIASLFPVLAVLYIVIILLTCRVVGEVGIVSQSTLPAVTGLMFIAGIRESMPYVMLDPYTGTPMPQFVAASSMNLIRLSKYSGIKPSFAGFLMMLGIVLGAPLTLVYGNILLAVYGTTSPKFPLVRWLPIVVWMNAVYTGDISALPAQSFTLGAVLAVFILFTARVLGMRSLSPFAVLVGITVTPDIGMLFIIAALIKYLALRIGPDAYESLVAYSSLGLFGSTLAVITYTFYELLGVGA
ncbi:MAG: hypothetical protein RMH84_01920 [Sulfolobales archaeon]|nr:hypothetical protein [Sulfolobales archaeon]MDW8010336.1 hypothetical protein [Sulfolobales archaeon]